MSRTNGKAVTSALAKTKGKPPSPVTKGETMEDDEASVASDPDDADEGEDEIDADEDMDAEDEDAASQK